MYLKKVTWNQLDSPIWRSESVCSDEWLLCGPGTRCDQVLIMNAVAGRVSPVAVKVAVVSMSSTKPSQTEWWVNPVCWPRRPRQKRAREREVYKKHLNSVQLTLSPSFNHQLSSPFLPLFPIFASRLLRLLFFRHIPPPPPISLFLSLFLVSLCCPQGVWDSFGDSLYVSWPELRRWGSFDGAGDYSSCSLGCTTLSRSSSVYILYVRKHVHWFPTQSIITFFPSSPHA